MADDILAFPGRLKAGENPRNPHNDSPENRLDQNLMFLDAATACITGDGFETFQNLADDLQHDYLYMLHVLAAGARWAQNEVDEKRWAEREKAKAGAQ